MDVSREKNAGRQTPEPTNRNHIVGRIGTDECTLIGAGADQEKRSSFSGKTIREHYETEPVWRICGTLFGK